jgi:hypothetical protein
MVERVSGLIVEKRSSEITAEWRIENPGKQSFSLQLPSLNF